MADGEASERAFIDRVAEAAAYLVEHTRAEYPVKLVSHVDSDGLTAASILAKALKRLGVGFQIRVILQVDEESLTDALAGASTFIVFTDLGSGSLSLIKEIVGTRRAMILDHHQPLGSESREAVFHVNPHLFGIDGQREISGSGVAYLTAKAMDAGNLDLSYLAIVGALGDLQDKNEERALLGLNRLIVQDAQDRGLVKVDKDLLFFGRETRPLHKALVSTTNPFIPGLSGEEGQCLDFLTGIGISLKEDDKWKVPAALTDEEKKTLFNHIVAFMAEKGFTSAASVNLIGTVYTFTMENRFTPLRDAREFSSLLNACSRVGKPGLGLSIALGDRREKIMVEADQTLAEYRRSLAQYMEALTGNPDRIRELEGIYIIKTEDLVSDRILSVVLSLISALPLFNHPKPIIGTAPSRGGKLKVSARCSDAMANQGVNLGVILEQAAETVGGRGGGHVVAAGAVIPVERRDEFLTLVNRFTVNQMGGVKPG